MTTADPFNFTGKVALVTGGTRGIGKELTVALAQRGARVYFCGTNEALGADVAGEINRTMAAGQAGVSFLKVDVSSFTACNEMVAEITAESKQIDFLINNAGITRDNLLLRLKESDWDEVMAVNLKGSFNCSKAVVRGMLKNRYGRIIFLSSVVGLMGNSGQVNYAAAKAGIIGMARSLARELASRNINSNVIAPGYIETEMTEAMDPKAQEKIQESIPAGRLGKVGDISNAALFLLSPMADYITGQVIQVDGGLLMA
ncbi:MAG: 3-oxoacyl-[acyl-carrier-protein] reductase [Deltaproteobacteria bacterium]|nr:3-oxoacyl-[acyl-carrier-protein] reductase [Deltaproteobacteria bacterium]